VLTPRWSPGETVLLQEVWRGRVWAARPVTVVRDDLETLALWLPRGTRWKVPTPPADAPDGPRGERLARTAVRGDWVFRDEEWPVSTLWLMREGDWHALWFSWHADGSPWGWYVNLQEPFRRARQALATMDCVLDVVVGPDGTWQWKDEDELAAWVAAGAIAPALAERLREEGLRVARRAERGAPPFAGRWPEWRPDPAWPLPVLPADWDSPCR